MILANRQRVAGSRAVQRKNLVKGWDVVGIQIRLLEIQLQQF